MCGLATERLGAQESLLMEAVQLPRCFLRIFNSGEIFKGHGTQAPEKIDRNVMGNQ